MAQFTGQLRPNEIFAALYNMIISQRVFADNISSTQSELVNMSKVDGTLYGDTKLFYATDILVSDEWDETDTNLLEQHRPQAPECQEIVIDNFRQIALTVDDYLSKRAWGDAASFGQFMAVMQGWIGLTKDTYEAKMFNSFIGTNTSDTSNKYQNRMIALPTNENTEVENRLQAQTIARELADLYVELADAGRYYNDYGNYRSFSKEDMVVVWNSSYVNKITNIDLPTIFHKEGLFDGFKHVLPAKYFGNVKTTGGTAPSTNTTIRTLVEKDYNSVSPSEATYDKKLHIFPGDLIPDGKTYAEYEAYEQDTGIIFKMYHKDAVPFMSAFEVGTSFFNAKSLSENRYLTWGYSTLENLDNYPFITVKTVQL